MGLDFSHCDAHWSYGGFLRFRNKLYNTAGFCGDLYKDYDTGKYQQSKNDPIYDLLNHSDCDGELTVNQMIIIIPRLKQLISNWQDDDYDKKQGLLLIEGMELAINENISLKFT